jgi:RNA polymerase sporulation-specific sigma factor
VTRQIITAVKGATRKKHVPLQQYVSLQKKCNEDEGDATLLDFLPDTQVVDPETVVMDRFVREAVREAAQTELSDLESTVLNRYLDGQSYEEMAEDLSCRTKSIDNALQRVKRKIGERVLAKAG